MFVHRWPKFPLLLRYKPNVLYRGRTYGDLAAISGRKDIREEREEIFQTDEAGFRNSRNADKDYVDLILLGDSCGAGNGTSQDKTITQLLNDKYNVSTYNLSIAGNPWQELMNLKIELRRLKIRRNTCVLWMIFLANDLDELNTRFNKDMDHVHFNNIYKRILISLRTYRDRSPIRALLVRLTTQKLAGSCVTIREFINGKKIIFYNYYIDKSKMSLEQIIANSGFKILTSVFDNMRSFADKKGIKIIVVAMPSKEEIYDWVLDGDNPWFIKKSTTASAEALSELALSFNFDFFDLTPFLREKAQEVFKDSGEILWWYDDSHWNGKGHEVIATILYSNLLSRINIATSNGQ